MITTPLGQAVVEAAESRRSIRRYTGTPVTDGELEHLLGSAGQAPSAFNVQPWRWVAVRDQQLKDKLQAAAHGQPQVGAAPVLLVLYTDMRDALDNIEETFSPTLPAEKAAGTKAHLRKTLGATSDVDREGWGAEQSYIALGYLPREYAVEGRELKMEYFEEPFPIKVEAVGCKGLYDPANELPKT